MPSMNEHQDTGTQFCLRWNNHVTTIVSDLEKHLKCESLVDVTLFAEGQLLRAHKVVLSACSPYFQTIFSQTKDKHPIIVLKDVRYEHLKVLLEYMYKGVVNVNQDELSPLMELAASLKIKGLTDEDGRRSTRLLPPLSALDDKPSIRPRHDLAPPTPSSVLSAALTMPPNLSLSTPLTLPNMPSLSAIPANLSTTLASSLSRTFRPDSFMHPADMRRPTGEYPHAKRRRKHRGHSADYNDSGDSDGRSSGSPGDGVQNMHLPRIPATITPVAHHQQSPRDQPRDLSSHPSLPPMNLHVSQNNHIRDQSPSHPPLSRTPHLRGTPINLQSPYANHDSKLQDHPEDLKRPVSREFERYPRSLSPSSIRHNNNSSHEDCNNTSPASDHMSNDKSSSHDRNSLDRSYSEKSPTEKFCHNSPVPKQFRDEHRLVGSREIKKDSSEQEPVENHTAENYSMERNPLLDRSILEKIPFDRPMLDKSLIDPVLWEKLAQDRLFIEKMTLDRNILDKFSIDKNMIDKNTHEKFLRDRFAMERNFLEKNNHEKTLLEKTLLERSPSEKCYERSARTPSSGNSGSSLPSLPQPSPKGSETEAIRNKPEAALHQSGNSGSGDGSSDTNHSDDEGSDCNENNGERSIESSATAGPSTSSRPHSEEAPQTPNYLGWGYPEASSADESYGDNSNPDYLRSFSFLRAGISGLLPNRIPRDLLGNPNPMNLPLLMPGGRENKDFKPMLYPFQDGQKQFTCEKCGRTYASTGNLKRHKKYECGVEPQFACPICQKKFQHRHSVKIHVFSTHRTEAGDVHGDAPREAQGIYSSEGVSAVVGGVGGLRENMFAVPQMPSMPNLPQENPPQPKQDR